MKVMEDHSIKVPKVKRRAAPTPPPLLYQLKTSGYSKKLMMDNYIATAARDMYDRLFDEGYRADVIVYTDNGGTIYAHANVIGTASPVIKGMLKKANRHGHWKVISIRGVPQNAVRAFIRFLYSSSYDKEDINEYVIHLLVLSHAYQVNQLKKLCQWHLENGLLTVDNLVDVFQLSLLCDAPRLTFVCHRTILKNFRKLSSSAGWIAMKQSHPNLEKQVLESLIDEENRQKERTRKHNERKIYLQLYDAMEALVHICRDGCKTIGPHDKDLKQDDEEPCTYRACKGMELLVRHFAGCKLRVPGGCIHCKRMWQLLELHSRLCADSEQCRVPLCRNFLERSKKQSKKEEMRWQLLVRKILSTKKFGGSAFFLSATNIEA